MAKVMAFVDGENLTARFEAMVAEGKVPRTESRIPGATLVQHLQKRLAWSPNTVKDLYPGDVLDRAYYYTTFVGAEDELENFSATVGQCAVWEPVTSDVEEPPHPIRLIPRVFKKSVRATKTKSVDISLCVDVLECVKNNALDAVYLVSGDIDYRPLIEAVMRAGKRVYVASLSSGCAPHLPNIPDRYIDLDSVYFRTHRGLESLRVKAGSSS
jgi:uncharacterized LabA/DUF88 family protein